MSDYVYYPESGELVRLHEGRPDGDLETVAEIAAQAYLNDAEIAALNPEMLRELIAVLGATTIYSPDEA